MADSIEQLSFELTAGALAEQERAVAALRTRAGTVLATASIAGSFGATANHSPLGSSGVLAMASFAICVGSAIWVLVPHEFVFAFSGKMLLAEDDHRATSDVAEAYRAASVWIEPNLGANDDKVARLSDWLTVSCVMLACEIIMWTLHLIG